MVLCHYWSPTSIRGWVTSFAKDTARTNVRESPVLWRRQRRGVHTREKKRCEEKGENANIKIRATKSRAPKLAVQLCLDLMVVNKARQEERRKNKRYMCFMEIVQALVTTETSHVHNTILWLCGLVQHTWSVEELRR